jgi:hypothetical protein
VYVTVIVKPHLATWPSLDWAVTLTLVVPTAKANPDTGSVVIVTGAIPPDVVALKFTTTGPPF